jgi:TetR/AcrR family transcriptional regulator
MANIPLDNSADAKRARILEAAFEVCAQRGVEGSRMEEVAALAQVSKGTLYHLFENKQDLFLASIIDSYEESLELFEGPAQDAASDPRERLDALLAGLVRVLEVMGARMTVHYQAFGVVAGDDRARVRLYGFLAEFFAARAAEIVETIEAGQRQGVFAPDVKVAAFNDAITALLSGFLYRATFDPANATPSRLANCFEVLIRAPLATPGSTDARGADGRS